MLGNFIKRLVNLVVLGFAALAFFLVPLGKKTAFQHCIAVFTSPPAREAEASFAEAGRRASTSIHAEMQKLLGAKKTSSPGRSR